MKARSRTAGSRVPSSVALWGCAERFLAPPIFDIVPGALIVQIARFGSLSDVKLRRLFPTHERWLGGFFHHNGPVNLPVFLLEGVCNQGSKLRSNSCSDQIPQGALKLVLGAPSVLQIFAETPKNPGVALF